MSVKCLKVWSKVDTSSHRPVVRPPNRHPTSVNRFHTVNGKASSTPRTLNDPYMTLDVSSSLSSSPEEEEESDITKSPVRKRKETAKVAPPRRALRNHVLNDSSSTSLDSSAIANLSTPPEGVQCRIVPKRKQNFTNFYR